jgi:hypothetical protein
MLLDMDASSSPKLTVLENQPDIPAMQGKSQKVCWLGMIRLHAERALRPSLGGQVAHITTDLSFHVSPMYMHAANITGILYWSFTLHDLGPNLLRRTPVVSYPGRIHLWWWGERARQSVLWSL